MPAKETPQAYPQPLWMIRHIPAMPRGESPVAILRQVDRKYLHASFKPCGTPAPGL